MGSSGAISAARVADLERRLAVAEAERTSAEAARAEAESRLATSEEARARLERMIAQMRRDKFGATSEKSDPDQQHLPRRSPAARRRPLARPGGTRGTCHHIWSGSSR